MASAATAKRRTIHDGRRGGPAPMIVISRLGPRHAADTTPSNHYSMLLTIEEGFALARLGYTSDSSQVHPLWPLIARS